MDFSTADLCDDHPEVQVLGPDFFDFGGRARFAGPVRTVEAPEDNSLVRKALAEPGEGAVLVVDGSGSTACALLGDQLAALAAENGWAGVVVFGYVRDREDLARIDLGVKALGTLPRKSEKLERGTLDEPVSFGGVVFRKGAWLYSDPDGLIVADERLV